MLAINAGKLVVWYIELRRYHQNPRLHSFQRREWNPVEHWSPEDEFRRPCLRIFKSGRGGGRCRKPDSWHIAARNELSR